jgi:two-component system, OmpR family, KDP operon response regulator KdpE
MTRASGAPRRVIDRPGCNAPVTVLQCATDDRQAPIPTILAQERSDKPAGEAPDRALEAPEPAVQTSSNIWEEPMSTQPLVLVADDEPRITKLVAIALSEEGFRVVTANGGEQALQKAEEVRPDIVLLDIVMPDLDGIEVMRQLRERRPVPVILLTAKGSTADKAKGLDLGADDYIAKPFHPDELAARVRAVIRRSGGAEPGAGVIKFDDVEIDLERRMVTRSGELVQLSRTEWLLLQHLAANAGKVVLHTELLTKVWGPEYRDDLQYLRVWVSRVRRKLGAAPGEPGRIRTFQGIGYLLDVEAPQAARETAPEEVRQPPEAALIG